MKIVGIQEMKGVSKKTGKLSWASGGDVIGDLLPSWYDDMCADIRDIDMPERLTERSLFSELTVEQLSLLESAEQVPVPWDM